ncbi:MAG: hypothetical protein ACI814_005136, partial [Mariniblastus sp.]
RGQVVCQEFESKKRFSDADVTFSIKSSLLEQMA